MPEHTILIVEDDVLLSAILVEKFRLLGYKVLSVTTGKAFTAALTQHAVSLILLDLNLPDADGMELLRELRKTSNVLLIVMSGRLDERNRILALTLGADDFVSKPVSPQEITLRVRNLLARQQHSTLAHSTPPLSAPAEDLSARFCNGWRLDSERRVLIDEAGAPHTITQAEFFLLRMLVDAQGAVVSRDALYEHLAALIGLTNIETLSTLVYRLRRKMPAPAGTDVIVTHSRVGYRLALAKE
jgi:DNA-binding response OmpR family regulator